MKIYVSSFLCAVPVFEYWMNDTNTTVSTVTILRFRHCYIAFLFLFCKYFRNLGWRKSSDHTPIVYIYTSIVFSFVYEIVISTLTELLFPTGDNLLQIVDGACDDGGGINDVWTFGCDFVVFSKIKIVPIAEPLAGIRSFNVCNCVAKFCNNVRISSLASCSDKRCSESFQVDNSLVSESSRYFYGALIVIGCIQFKH